MEQKKFKTEVSQLLNLIIHSLYSNKEIFLREIISNASDALDKLKYLVLTDAKFKDFSFDPRIDISFTEGSDRTLTVSDNGIGMTHDEFNENLGTIARSGTKKFLERLSNDQKKDSNLIGQFGVGFYSVFMVAKRVEVISRKAGEQEAWKWSSDGKGVYTLEEAERETQGTTVIMYLSDDGSQYANRWQIEQLVKKYSDHIAFPIFLAWDQTSYDDKKKDKEGNPKKKVEHKVEQINNAAALWRKNKSSLTDDDYKDFYKSTSHDSQDPLFYLHTQAEGAVEYTTLFFIPAEAPFDMYHADYRPGVKLYVKRVYITDDDKELLPPYLRFVRGVIDSEDLPLNVSREILQQNRVMTTIRNASVGKLLAEFKKISNQNPELYDKFIEQYNRPLKEGLYGDFANREELMDLVRFKSTDMDGYVSLASYKERMPEEQKAIYYITGQNEQSLRKSPLLEGYRKKGFEVLLMTDDIDDLVIGAVGTYKEVPLKAINKAGAMDDLNGQEKKNDSAEAKGIAEKIKKALGESVKDVIVSSRLSDVSAVIVVDDDELTIQMQQMFRAMGQGDYQMTPILEINVDDPVVKKIGATDDEATIADISEVLLGQALLNEGVMPKNPADFTRRLHILLANI